MLPDNLVLDSVKPCGFVDFAFINEFEEIIAASEDGEVAMWHLRVLRRRHVFSVEGGWTRVQCVAASSNRKLVAASAPNNCEGGPCTIVWQLTDYSPIATFPDAFESISFSEDGRHLVGWAKGLWTVHPIEVPEDSESEMTTPSMESLMPEQLATNPALVSQYCRGNQIASNAVSGRWAARRDNALVVFDGNTGQTLWTNENFCPKSIAFSHDGLRIAAAAPSGQIHVFDAESGLPTANIRHSRGRNPRCLRFVPFQAGMAAITDSGAIELWKLPSGARVLAISRPSRFVVGLETTPEGKLVTTHSDYSIRTWDIERLEVNPIVPCMPFRRDVQSSALDKTGELLTTTFVDGSIAIMDLKREDFVASYSGVQIHHGIAVSRTQAIVACTSARGRYYGSELFDFTLGEWIDSPFQDDEHFNPHLSSDVCVAFKTEGLRVLEPDTLAPLFEEDRFATLVSLAYPRNYPYPVSVSWDRRWMALCNEGRIILWDLTENRFIRNLECHRYREGMAAWSRDGGVIAAISHNSEGISLYHWRDPTDQPKQLESKRKQILKICFIHHDRLIAGSGEDGIVTLWDVTSGEALAELVCRQFEISDDEYDDEWAIITSDGDIAGSENCHRLFLRKDGGEWKPATADAATFQRHEAVRRKLGLSEGEKREAAAEGDWKWKVLDSCFNSEPSSDR